MIQGIGLAAALISWTALSVLFGARLIDRVWKRAVARQRDLYESQRTQYPTEAVVLFAQARAMEKLLLARERRFEDGA